MKTQIDKTFVASTTVHRNRRARAKRTSKNLLSSRLTKLACGLSLGLWVLLALSSGYAIGVVGDTLRVIDPRTNLRFTDPSTQEPLGPFIITEGAIGGDTITFGPVLTRDAQGLILKNVVLTEGGVFAGPVSDGIQATFSDTLPRSLTLLFVSENGETPLPNPAGTLRIPETGEEQDITGLLFRTARLATDPADPDDPLTKPHPLPPALVFVLSDTEVPEPSTWLLLGSGLVGLVLWRRKRTA